MQRDVKTRFGNQWQTHMTNVWDQTNLQDDNAHPHSAGIYWRPTQTTVATYMSSLHYSLHLCGLDCRKVLTIFYIYYINKPKLIQYYFLGFLKVPYAEEMSRCNHLL